MRLTPELVLHAYRRGLFPMADSEDDPETYWVEPKLRGVIPLDGFHISRSLAKALRRDHYTVSINRAFPEVLTGCADRDRTWINGDIRSVFEALHSRGDAHSLEVWNREGALIGGVYGLALGGAFFGESMFSRETNASKIALAWLTCHLRRCGFTLFDTQFITDHLATLGAEEISREDYLVRLRLALGRSAQIDAMPLPASGQDVVQFSTQTS